MSTQLGLLVPRSGLYPTIGFDLQAGLQAGLAGAGTDFTINVENIGYGEKESIIYSICEKQLLQGYKIIAAYINPSVAAALQPLFEAAGALLLVLDSGYHFPIHTGRLANVLFLSLQGALCCRAAAAAAVRDGYRQLAYTASYYDAGYRPPYVMARAAEAGGGAVAYTHITTLKRVEFSLAPLEAWLKANAAITPALLATFCGDMSTDFLLHLSRFEQLPKAVYAGPYVAEEKWLAQSVYPGMDFHAWIPWDPSIPTLENEQLAAQLGGRRPTLFSMFAYEAGLLMTAVLASGLTGQGAIETLATQSFNSPRGTLRIDPVTQQSIAPVYRVTIGEDSSTGKCCLVKAPEAIPDLDAQWTSFQEDIRSFQGLPASNWLNAYPCIE